MNTRLQVEHPITELISRIDLVEWMIRVAAGQPLPITDQNAINARRKGWAIEARVYAEDPKTYLPCIGRLRRYVEPKNTLALFDGTLATDKEPHRHQKGKKSSAAAVAAAEAKAMDALIWCDATGVRCDSGIVEGSEISIYYDPMICKLSTFGHDRSEAIARMVQALDHYIIQGPTHNIPLLREIVTHPKFVSGAISTKFLAEEYPKGFDGHALTELELNHLVSMAAAIRFGKELAHYTDASPMCASYLVKYRDHNLTVNVTSHKDGFHVQILQGTHDRPEAVFVIKPSPYATSSLYRASIQGTQSGPVTELTVQILDKTSPFHLALRAYGTVYDLELMTQPQSTLNAHMKPKPVVDHSKMIVSPMPGAVIDVRVATGDAVREGTELVVVEAMKMQNVLRAQKAGKVKAILVKKGQNVATDDLLIEME